MFNALAAPSLEQLEKYNVNVEGQPEVVWQPRYDYQVYPAAGFTELKFFQVPDGQSSKTFDDTNMTLAGQLPSPKNLMIVNLQVYFFPGTTPGRTGAISTTGLNWRDVFAVGEAGRLVLTIGSKDYLTDAPLMKFAPRARLAGVAALADSTTAAANAGSQIDYATWAGPLYRVVPLRIITSQDFSVSLRFATAVATPSTVAGRIGVVLEGYEYRLAQ